MKKLLFSLSLLPGLAGSTQAQSPCAVSVTKSGIGLTRTYTASSAANNAGFWLFAYPIGGNLNNNYGSSITNTLTVTYPFSGIFEVNARAQNPPCVDSVIFLDTVVAPPSPCAVTLTKSGTGLTRTYTVSSAATGSNTSYGIRAYGASSATSTLTMTYPFSGVFGVTGHVTTPGCTDTTVIFDTVTGPPPPPVTGNNLYIHLYVDSIRSIPNYTAQVKTWLIKKDNIAGTLTAVDSVIATITDAAAWNTNVTTFSNLPAGTYRTKSHITNQPAGAITGFLPTYSNNKAYWGNADTFVFTSNTVLVKNNLLLSGIPTSGPGFIGGLISAGANKGTAVGDPVAGINVFLRDNVGKVVKMTTSGADGKYAFNNLATGTYTVYPEELNYSTIASDPIVIADAQSTNGKNYNFKRNVSAKEYVSGTVLGVGTIGDISFSIAPNPATDKLQISLGKSAGKTTATLSNTAGQVVLQEVITGSNATLSVNQLPAGVYMLQLQNGTEIHIEKVQIQH